MKKNANRIFWIGFMGFSIFAVLFLGFFKAPVDPEMGFANAVILTLSILASGAVLRYWFHKNQDKFKG